MMPLLLSTLAEYTRLAFILLLARVTKKARASCIWSRRVKSKYPRVKRLRQVPYTLVVIFSNGALSSQGRGPCAIATTLARA